MRKKKVVILGAGPSGLAAAFGLSDSPELREQYDITIYQAGWRAGGKCTTGREGPANRIVQNGTHYLFGCYDNCFDTVKRAYDELNAAGVSGFGPYDEAFLPRELLVFKQFFQGKWYLWPIEFPSNRTEPGTHDGRLPFGDYLSMAIQFLIEAVAGWRVLRAVKPPGPFSLSARRPGMLRTLLIPVEKLAGGAIEVIALLLKIALRLARSLVRGAGMQREALRAIVWIVREVRRWAWWLLGRHVESSLDANRAFTLIDFTCATVIGVIEDGVYEPGGLSNIEGIEFRAWLEKHGARDITTYAPFVTTWYDAVAAYEDGDLNRPNLSAAVSLYAIARAMLTYKGSFAYQMRSEIGDTFVAPIFDCLRQRGVRFNFFHRVWDVVPGEGDEIDEIVIERQVELVSGDPASYDPFMVVKGQKAWPNEPLWRQIKDHDKVRGHDLESFYTTWRGKDFSLKKGEDFDIVVFALPVDLIRFYCKRIVAERPEWQRLIDQVNGVETQSIRLWFRPTLREIGWRTGPPILSAYAPPFSTWEDNGQLAEVETWPQSHMPHAMATVFGALPAPTIPPGPEDTSYPERQKAVADANAMKFMEDDIGPLWPGATRPDNPLGIDWDLLIDLEDRKGAERMKAQYVRANAGPVERYTMAKAGCAPFRLAADESGYRNMVLAGDWIRNGFIIESVEGAMIGGLQASQAISGFPEKIPNVYPGL